MLKMAVQEVWVPADCRVAVPAFDYLSLGFFHVREI